MQTYPKFYICSTKVNTNFFSASPVLSLTPRVDPSPKKLFFWLSVWDDELLSTPKITRFLAKSLSKLLEPSPSNAIPRPL